MKLVPLLRIYLLVFFPVISMAQSLPNPFDFPILLSGNFGELRSNHFHSGIDFKTQGVVDKPIYAPADGYVSRISISPWGYGNALYLNHPDGTTTVYGHLHRYTDAVAKYIKEQQYAKEEASLNLYPPTDSLSFRKGEIVAWSGNTGSSAGPHLHFEIRDTQTEEVLDPLPYFKEQIKDTRPPVIKGFAIYPQLGKGIANGSTKAQKLKLIKDKKGKPAVSTRIEAWGDVAFGIRADDSMDGTNNIYGVKLVELIVDDTLRFKSNITRFAFDETRYINSLIDYGWWANERLFYMKSFVEPGNYLPFLESKNRGILHINKERSYKLCYLLTDLYGNQSSLTVDIIGKKQTIPSLKLTDDTPLFSWRGSNRFGEEGIRLTIPQGNLYTDLLFNYHVRPSKTTLASIHQLHDTPLALHKSAQLSLRILQDTLRETRHYGIVRLNKGRSSTWIGGKYRNGWMIAPIRELGRSYSIMADMRAPSITPLGKNSWVKQRKISFRLTDNLSGVQSFRGEIDGEYALFQMNSKSVITYHFDRQRLKPGKHHLSLSVKDACGNESTYEYNFSY